MIIGLNGRLKSGKDTTFSVIQEFFPEAERVSFAEPLKRSAAASIGISVDDLERLKGLEVIKFRPHIEDSRDLEGADFNFFIRIKEPVAFNVRQYLQWYGTEGHREVFGDDFWVDQALAPDLDHSDRLIVVTDMRFPNEAQRVLDLGGVTVKVERETATAHADHPSEQNIDPMIEYFLDNRGTIEDLRANVSKLLLELGNEPVTELVNGLPPDYWETAQ